MWGAYSSVPLCIRDGSMTSFASLHECAWELLRASEETGTLITFGEWFTVRPFPGIVFSLLWLLSHLLSTAVNKTGPGTFSAVVSGPAIFCLKKSFFNAILLTIRFEDPVPRRYQLNTESAKFILSNINHENQIITVHGSSHHEMYLRAVYYHQEEMFWFFICLIPVLFFSFNDSIVFD